MTRAALDIRGAALLAIAAASDPYPETRAVEPAPKPAPPPQEPWPDALTGEWGNRAERRKAKRKAGKR
jgi:hypothetical protein